MRIIIERIRANAFFIAVLFAPGLIGGGNVRAGEFALVSEEAAPPPVCYLKTDNRRAPELLTAGNLAKYLQRISGKAFTATPVERTPEGRAILIGKICGNLPEDPGGDGFMISITDEQIRIAGATPRGTAIGVYAFLEDMLGCRWWSHNEEDVPQQAVIRLTTTNKLVKPIFWQTDLMNREASSMANDFAYKRRGVSTEVFDGGHSLYPYLESYANTNNDFYPYDRKQKKRGHNKLHFCYTAPGIAEALAEVLATRVAAQKGNVRDYIYQAGMGDWYGGMCECDRCQAVYDEEKWTRPDGVVQSAPSSTLIRMMNKTGEILEKKHPGVRVSTFAYMSLEGPPGKTVPRDNVAIWIPHLRHCIIHGVEKCPANNDFLQNLKRWREIAPGRVYVWDYAVNYGENFLYPFPVVRSMGENIKSYAKLGVKGVRLQGNYVSTGGDLVALKNWVWGKLLWNPELDADDLTKEFCRGYYGPAAEELIKYVLTLEDMASGSPAHMDEFGKLGRMQAIYLGINPLGKLRQSLGKNPADAYGQETASMLQPLLSDEMKNATAEEWQKKIQPLLEADIAMKCGAQLANDLRKQINKAVRNINDGKAGAAAVAGVLGKNAKGTYGKETVDLLNAMQSDEMKAASKEAWEKKLASLLGDDLTLACGKHRVAELHGILKAAQRDVFVWNKTRELRPLLEKALEKAGEAEPFKRRVLEAMVSLEAVELWRDGGRLEEKNGELVRMDLGEKATWQRAFSMLKHSREASPREWNSYRTYHLSLMNQHGGPLVRLKKDDLQVKVTPWLQGRIRQIVFNGRELLRTPTDPKESGYPSLGGAYEIVTRTVHVADLVGEPTERRVEMLAGTGSRSAPVQMARKIVEIMDDNAIRVTWAGTCCGWDKDARNASGVSVTEYVVGSDKDSFSIKALTGDEWLDVALGSPPPEKTEKSKTNPEPLPPDVGWAALSEATKALRIELKGQGCMVEDRYLSPAVQKGNVQFNPKSGLLITRVATLPMELDLKKEMQWLEREIRINAGAAAPDEQTVPADSKGEERKPENQSDDVNTTRPDMDRARDLERFGM